VGKTYLCGEDMYMSAMKGKCLNIINIYTDNLWAMGDKSIEVPNIPTPEPEPEKKSENKEVNSNQVPENEAIDTGVEPKLEIKENDELEKKIENLELKEDENKSVEVDHEKVLEDSFLCAIKFKQKEFKLPVIVSTFMKIMQTCW
jgi:translation initiation factor 2D